MKNRFQMGVAALAIACAGMTARAEAGSVVSERWHGFMLRNGLQVPIAVELAARSTDWAGQLRVGNDSVPLEHVRITGLGVHFEVPGDAAFDGTVAGNWMAGSVSGSAASGSFALTRESDQPFADPITSSGP